MPVYPYHDISPLPVALPATTGDAFGRLRSSNPVTLFDSKQIHDNAPLFWDDQEVSGTGTSSSHSAAKASTTISVGNTTAGKRVRQTFQRFNYQPGKSQLILLTGQIDTVGTGITAGMGYFDDDNGVFAKITSAGVSFNIRSSVTGSPVDTSVAQAEWNGDKLDGTGDSRFTLDPTKTQIVWFDLEWLGVGSVRCGFVINGQFILCHTFHHANTLSVVYMSTPNLPLRYEIENSGTGAATSMQHICATVISEGGQEKNGLLRHRDSGSISSLVSGTTYALVGVRLQAAKLGGSIEFENVSLLAATQNDKAHWALILNPTVAGTFTYSNFTNSIVQTATGAVTNTVTGGTELDGGYFSTEQAAITSIPNALRLGSTISGTPDSIVLCVKPVTTNITVESSITWRELS